MSPTRLLVGNAGKQLIDLKNMNKLNKDFEFEININFFDNVSLWIASFRGRPRGIKKWGFTCDVRGSTIEETFAKLPRELYMETVLQTDFPRWVELRREQKNG